MTSYNILNGNSHLALDIHGGETNGGQKPGTPAVQYGSIPTAKTQLWQFVMPNVQASGFLLENEYGLALGPTNEGWPWVSGQTPDPGSMNQLWSLLSLDGHTFSIVNLGYNELGNKTVLDVPTHGKPDGPSAMDPGTQIQLYPQNGGNNQQWLLNPSNSGQAGLAVKPGFSSTNGWWTFELVGAGFAASSSLYLWLMGTPIYDGSLNLFPQLIVDLNGAQEPIKISDTDSRGSFHFAFSFQETVNPEIPAPNSGWVTVVATDSVSGVILCVDTMPNFPWYSQGTPWSPQ
jgi:hypothetical protein